MIRIRTGNFGFRKQRQRMAGHATCRQQQLCTGLSIFWFEFDSRICSGRFFRRHVGQKCGDVLGFLEGESERRHHTISAACVRIHQS